MFGAFERMVAMRYLRARRQEGFISVIAWFSLLGIGLGVATLIIVMSVMNGFRHELLTRILGVNGHISVYDNSSNFTDYPQLAEQIKNIPGVVDVTPTIEGQVMTSANGQATGALVRGLAPEELARHPIVANNIVFGNLADFTGNDSIMIGDKLARQLGVRVGDSVNLISPKGSVTAFGSVPRMKAYKVVAMFDIGMYEYDSRFIFMPLDAAQIYFQLPQAISFLDVRLNNPDDATARANDMRRSLGPKRTVYDWQQSNSSFFTAIQVERNVMFLILTLIIVVAAFNIISSLIMLVKDKGRDIAILRTMGATRGMIMRIFLLSGASVGVIGTIFGLVLGVVFADNIETIRQWVQHLSGTDVFQAEIYFLSQLPAIVDPGEVTLVVGMGLVLSFLATLYPSWRAARLDPVEALRYE